MSSATADPSPCAPSLPPPARLTEAERARMLEGVEKMILKALVTFRIPPRAQDDAAQACRLILWKLSEAFDPTGAAKWSTFAHVAIKRTLLRVRDDGIKDETPGGLPTVQLDAARTPAPEPDEAEDDDERTGELATAVRRQLAGPALAVLTPKLRRLVEAVLFDRLTIDQFAEQHGHPAKIVRRHLALALGQLMIAGNVPANLARRFGFDVADLAARTDRAAANRKTAARRELIAEALALGWLTKRIAAELGEPVGTVNRDARAVRAGSPVPVNVKPVPVAVQAKPLKPTKPPKPSSGRNRRAAGRREEVRELNAQGLSREQIARMDGCSVSTVYNCLREPVAVAV